MAHTHVFREVYLRDRSSVNLYFSSHLDGLVVAISHYHIIADREVHLNNNFFKTKLLRESERRSTGCFIVSDWEEEAWIIHQRYCIETIVVRPFHITVKCISPASIMTDARPRGNLEEEFEGL